MDSFCVRFTDYSGKVKQRCIHNVANEDAAILEVLTDVRGQVKEIVSVTKLEKVDLNEWHNAEIKNKSNAVGLDCRHEK